MTLRVLRVVALASLALIACFAPARAAWSNDPTVNTRVSPSSTTFMVGGSSIESDGAGGAFVAWSNYLVGSSSDLDIRLQRIDARGRRMWESEWSFEMPGIQWIPQMLADGEGGVFLAWDDDRDTTSRIWMQHVSATGQSLWGAAGLELGSGPWHRSSPHMVADGAGGLIVTWSGQRDAQRQDADIYAQRIRSDGSLVWAPEGVPVCSDPGSQYDATLGQDGAGGVLVVWRDFRNSTPLVGFSTWYAQRLNAAGTAMWTTNGVRLHTDYGGYHAAVYSDGAGGALLAWWDAPDDGPVACRVQRLNAAGVEQWAPNGVALASVSGYLMTFHAISDAAGGMIVAWSDTLPGQHRTWVQRVNSSGASQWTAGGVLFEQASSTRFCSNLVPDGVGGAHVLFSSGWYETSRQDRRITANGTSSWPAVVPFCTAPGERYATQATSDGAGGVLLAWLDNRPGGGNVPYAQRVDRWGQLGAQPNISRVHDWPNDQGGYVLAEWTKSPLDTPPTSGVSKYRFWRQAPAAAAQTLAARGLPTLRSGDDVPEGADGALLQLSGASGTEWWEYMGELVADGRALYNAGIATACDSVPGSNPTTMFMIEARSGDGARWWYSDPVEGYSADNLAPATPASFFAVWSAGQTQLHWPRSTEADFKEYRLYKGDWPNFVPSEVNRVATVGDTGYTQANAHPIGYKIVAVDIHGNASPARWTPPSGTTGVGEGMPLALAFAPVTPNPVRGAAALRFALPAAGRVTLAVYDAQGRRVRSLIDATLPAGEHASRWDACGDTGRALSAGLYYVRLDWAGNSLVRRCVLAP